MRIGLLVILCIFITGCTASDHSIDLDGQEFTCEAVIGSTSDEARLCYSIDGRHYGFIFKNEKVRK